MTRNQYLRPIEYYLIAELLMFGIILAIPMDTFNNSAYFPMGVIATEQVWGGICIFIALMQGLSAYFPKNLILTIFAMVLTVIIWLIIGIMFIIAGIFDGAIYTGIIYILSAFLAMFLTYAKVENTLSQ